MRQADKQEIQPLAFPETYTRRRLNALYREIPLRDTVFRTLRKYFKAMTNLYGIISIEKAYEIISEQSPSLVTKEEFLAFAEIARHERENYGILGEEEVYLDGKSGTPWEREIIDIELLFGNNEDDPYTKMKRLQQGKPYYVPEKKELLLYADPSYCESTPEAAALQAFISTQPQLSEIQKTEIFRELLYFSRYLQIPFSEILQDVGNLGLTFNNNAALQKFASLEQDFHNTTRMQCNRGYTPMEIFEMQPPERRIPMTISLGANIRASLANGTMNLQELRNGILTAELPNEGIRFNLLKELAEIERDCKASKQSKEKSAPKKKVGRNDPCPCGSGKKYKKCCGR